MECPSSKYRRGNGAERTTALGELAGSGERFARAYAEAEVQIEIPREVPDAPEPETHRVAEPEKKLGTIWNNPHDDPNPPKEDRSWGAFFKACRKTYDEINEVCKPQRNRTMGQFIDQLLDTALNQLHPSVRHVESAEPSIEVPEWWKGVRRPMDKLIEGIHKNPWWMAPLIGGGFFGGATAPLPGPNAIGYLLAIPAGLGALAIKFFGYSIGDLDRLAVSADKLGRRIGWGLKMAGRYSGINWLGTRILRPFDRAGHAIDKRFGWGEYREGHIQSKIQKKAEAGDLFGGAPTEANRKLRILGMPGAYGFMLDLTDVASPKTYKQDLLDNLDIPTEYVDLAGVLKFVSAGSEYQSFKAKLNRSGYDCQLVLTEHTIVLETWKIGGEAKPHEQE